MNNSGWICPKCSACYAPWMPHCSNCTSIETTITFNSEVGPGFINNPKVCAPHNAFKCQKCNPGMI